MARKLTKRVCDAAEYEGDGKSRHVVWDDEIKGFGLRVYPSGRRAFILSYRAGRRARLLTIGDFGVLTVQQARDIAKRHLAEVIEGGDPLAERKKARAGTTVREIETRYLEDHAELHKKASSLRNDKQMWKSHIRPRLGSLRVADVTTEDIRALHGAMRKTPTAANRVLALLSKAFNLAEKWGMCDEGTNPCKHVQRYRERRHERFLDDAERVRVFNALASTVEKKECSQHASAAIALVLLTGARPAEILTLRWEHVDLERGVLNLPDSKTGEKQVYLSDAAAAVLAGLPRTKDNPWVIEGQRRGAHMKDLKRPWERVCKAAKLEDVRLYDLRHTYASVAAANGVPLYTISKLLGHKSVVTTQRYAHLAADPLRRAAEDVGRRM